MKTLTEGLARELIEKLTTVGMRLHGSDRAWDRTVITTATDTITCLENELLAATIRIENDKLEIEGWKVDQKENLKNQCDLVAERDEWKERCEFSFKERDKLLATNASLVRDKESDRLAYLAMRDERDAYQQAADTQAMAHKVERDEPMNSGWVRAADDEMIGTHLGVANLSDSYVSAKAKLKMLIDWHVAVATDHEVNGGYQLVPVEPTKEIMEAVLGHGVDNGTDTQRYVAIATRFYGGILRASAKGKP